MSAGQEPQYTIATRTRFGTRELGGETEPAHDPFHTTQVEVTLSRLDALRALLRPRSITVEVRVDGSRAAVQHVMREIDLAPNDVTPRHVEGAYYEERPICRYGELSSQSADPQPHE